MIPSLAAHAYRTSAESRQEAFENSPAKMVELLQSALQYLHVVLCEGNVLKEREIIRCASATSLPFFNAVFGLPAEQEKAVNEQIAFFQARGASFVWFVEVSGQNSAFESFLTAQGFRSLGIFQGIVRDLSLPISEPSFPLGYHVEQIQSLDSLKRINEFLVDLMKMTDPHKQMRNKFYEDEFQRIDTPITHWAVKHQNKVVSTNIFS